ncbi:MAG: ATPase [Calditrichaeota bacterium]|nr:MAG: ATPase [Calditrichota bacterium]
MRKRKEKIRKLLEGLSNGVYEKEEIIRLTLLSSIAGESIFLLGQPGVAKSLVARKLKFAFQSGQAFEYLMSRFSTPDEVFGPVSIKKLKENDKYERLTEKYLPGANIVFLDEIWKASPPIQNSLLTVLNEKIYRNGEQEMKVDIRGLIAASNELPTKGEGLEALWDRFLIRFFVEGIQDRDNFENMISDVSDPYKDEIPTSIKISDREYQSWFKEINKIEIPENVLEIIDIIRKQIVERNRSNEPESQIFVSDRRWKKIIRLLRTSAFLNERKSIDLADTFLIPYCIWTQTEQIQEVKNIVIEVVKTDGDEINPQLIEDELKKFQIEFRNASTRRRKVDYFEVLNLFSNREYEDEEKTLRQEGRLFISRAEFYGLKELESRDLILYYQNGLSKLLPSSGIYNVSLVTGGHKIRVGNFVCSLSYTKSEGEEVRTLKPEKRLHKQWLEKLGQLEKASSESLKKISDYRDKEVASLMDNLFVEDEFCKIVLENLNRLENKLLFLQSEIQKTTAICKNIREETVVYLKLEN